MSVFILPTHGTTLKSQENTREAPAASAVCEANKCKIMKSSVEFLSQQIYKGGMTPTKVKLKAGQDWATPKDIKDVRPFLAVSNHY